MSNVNCFQRSTRVELTKNYSVNGDYSFKIMRDDTDDGGYTWVRFWSGNPSSDNFEVGETYTLQVEVYLINGIIDLWFGEDPSSGACTSTRLKNYSPTTISITRTLTINHNTIELRVNTVTDGAIAYVDNIRFMKV